MVALFLALFVVPLHMFWCLGSPLQNWADRKLARQGRLPAGVKIKHWLQLALLYFYLFMLFLISMYSSSATLQVCQATTSALPPQYPIVQTVMMERVQQLTSTSCRIPGLRFARGLPPQRQVARRVYRPALSGTEPHPLQVRARVGGGCPAARPKWQEIAPPTYPALSFIPAGVDFGA